MPTKLLLAAGYNPFSKNNQSMNCRLRCVGVAFAFLVATVFAQQAPDATPESVGLSTEGWARISEAVDRGIADKRISGAVTLVSRRGRVVWLTAQGIADREAAKPMHADSIFRICSMTKPVTSVAVMMLYEQGKFVLGDSISKYLPEFKNPKVLVKPATGEPYTIPAAREITIRDPLRHTSRIAYHWNLDVGPLYQKANVAQIVCRNPTHSLRFLDLHTKCTAWKNVILLTVGFRPLHNKVTPDRPFGAPILVFAGARPEIELVLGYG